MADTRLAMTCRASQAMKARHCVQERCYLSGHHMISTIKVLEAETNRRHLLKLVLNERISSLDHGDHIPLHGSSVCCSMGK